MNTVFEAILFLRTGLGHRPPVSGSRIQIIGSAEGGPDMMAKSQSGQKIISDSNLRSGR